MQRDVKKCMEIANRVFISVNLKFINDRHKEPFHSLRKTNSLLLVHKVFFTFKTKVIHKSAIALWKETEIP